MKYLILILALMLSGCASRYIVNTEKCEAIGGTWFNCKDNNSVQKY